MKKDKNKSPTIHADLRRLGCGFAALGLAFSVTLAALGGVTKEDIAKGIKKHIEERTQKDGGKFRIKDENRELSLTLVKVHNDKLANLGKGLYFACVDLKGDDGVIYDVDFFLAGDPAAMKVTETMLHKINRRPRYGWEMDSNGTWVKVPADPAVIRGMDQFEFTYRVRLPEIPAAGRLWLPLVKSDAFQKVQLKRITSTLQWKQIQDRDHGNHILFFSPTPHDSGKVIEVQYEVRRKEKVSYPAGDMDPVQHLGPERLVPVNKTFRDLALKVIGNRKRKLEQGRALYQHVLEHMEYDRTGKGWGNGDAVHACDSRSGNCTDFHAYFIALARSAGIPARFAIGATIPAGKNKGMIYGYHCWAEFLADGYWIPIDVSEAWRRPDLADYYFGHHPANRFEFSAGRDLAVKPGPSTGPINFLADALLEVEGKGVKAETEFAFQRERVSSLPW